MNGRLTGGAKCCLKGCENDVGIGKFDGLIGRYRIEVVPQELTDQHDVNNLRVCNKQYSSLASGGHKPAKGKTQSKTRSDAYHGILKVNPCIVQCSQSKKNVCLSSDIPCLKHNINVFNSFTLFSVACNFLDETYGSKTDFHHHLYQARDSNDKSQVNYICMSCQPFFLKSVKIQDEYKKAHAMFEKTQKSANPSILTADPVIEAKSKAGSITSTQASGEPEATFELLDVLSDLKGGIFAKGLLQLLEEHRPTPNTTGGCYASGECYPVPGGALVPNLYRIFESILYDIFPWTITFSNSKTTDNNLKVVLTKSNINITEGVQIPN